jgi:hypothetical protein
VDQVSKEQGGKKDQPADYREPKDGDFNPTAFVVGPQRPKSADDPKNDCD